jgi:hypothetical protein
MGDGRWTMDSAWRTRRARARRGYHGLRVAERHTEIWHVCHCCCLVPPPPGQSPEPDADASSWKTDTPALVDQWSTCTITTAMQPAAAIDRCASVPAACPRRAALASPCRRRARLLRAACLSGCLSRRFHQSSGCQLHHHHHRRNTRPPPPPPLPIHTHVTCYMLGHTAVVNLEHLPRSAAPSACPPAASQQGHWRERCRSNGALLRALPLAHARHGKLDPHSDAQTL